eukprot:TRINITY_DN418_c0_g1_i1.p1 TRINITY_DN418_c0_g1~~TRINITY_DN418_c0_g1_i1.p1  ORF type:complete len:252 (-),score=97.80 TRINITY_DN418_c0_g1_i1:123-785(-)
MQKFWISTLLASLVVLFFCNVISAEPVEEEPVIPPNTTAAIPRKNRMTVSQMVENLMTKCKTESLNKNLVNLHDEEGEARENAERERRRMRTQWELLQEEKEKEARGEKPETEEEKQQKREAFIDRRAAEYCSFVTLLGKEYHDRMASLIEDLGNVFALPPLGWAVEETANFISRNGGRPEHGGRVSNEGIFEFFQNRVDHWEKHVRDNIHTQKRTHDEL